jgi:hypothetical protein
MNWVIIDIALQCTKIIDIEIRADELGIYQLWVQWWYNTSSNFDLVAQVFLCCFVQQRF